MSRKQYDYSQLEGARQNLQNRAMDKIQNYDKVKQGVSAFNKANEQGNLIKDAMGTGIDLVKDATIEGGIAFAKKGIEGIASKVADYSDAFKGTEGGLEGLDKRITSRFTSIQRAKLRNAQNTRQNTRSRQAEEPEAEPGAEPAAEPTAEPAEPLDENPFSFENAGGLNEADSTTTFGDISDTQLKQRLIQTEDPVDAVQAQDEIDYRAKRANPDAEEGGGDAAADAGDAAEGGGDAAAAAGGGAGEGLIEGAAEVGAEAFGDIAAEGALTLLDATGIGAIIGVPLQIATGVGAVVGAVDVGEHLWKDFTDLFKGGNKSGDESAPAAPTFSTKLIAPTLES